jgi:SAM-dependent methyltransferase
MQQPDSQREVRLDRLPPALAKRYVALPDLGHESAPAAALVTARAGRVRTLAQRLLRHFVSDFDANGLVGIYRMQLLSTREWEALLGPPPLGRLLDIGAGSGDVTAELAPLFTEVEATEMSRVMCGKLRRRGFACRRIDLAEQPHGETFDVVTCLNVLDRCQRPLSLLANAVAALGPRGRLVLALALPYNPFYYDGAATFAPLEDLGCSHPEWETAVSLLVERALTPLGLTVHAFTRAAYVSSGDAEGERYVLDDVVIVAGR